MSNYFFNENKQFVIENYNNAKPFASFLPGIAGIDGVPMWTYYVNRGQLIAGFGVSNKDNPILDFVPANMAYRRINTIGFRTFIKLDGVVHEIFNTNDNSLERKMYIEPNSISISEVNDKIGIKVTVKYYTISHSSFPALMRRVKFESITNEEKHIQILDGLSTIWPYGTNNYATKNMSNLAVAWFEADNLKNKMPYFRNRSTTEDSSEMGSVECGNFYVSLNENDEILPIIADPDLVFGMNTTLSNVNEFELKDLNEILNEEQIVVNKIPCAFTAYDTNLKQQVEINSVIGQLNSINDLYRIEPLFDSNFFKEQELYAEKLINDIVNDVDVKTSQPLFDSYVKQCFLDNILRGGYPYLFKGNDKPIVYHVYSRIHGDMEREYNDFLTEASYFSQGNGNFRDVNQNRRNDVFFVKEAGIYNIKQFMELIQLDGNNPLSVRGSSFKIEEAKIKSILEMVIDKKEIVTKHLSGKFTPGSILMLIEHEKIRLTVDSMTFINNVLLNSKQDFEASYGHGYWTDHWTYNLDLIENYLKIYPDNLDELLYDEDYRYYESPITVLPRKDKYVLNKDGQVYQHGSLHYDHEKISLLKLDEHGTNWAKDKNGNLIQTNLYVKLLSLIINKFTSLDQYGIGIMMNTDKPGWNDAMNGLPGIFGSGVSETIELKRLTEFLINNTTNLNKFIDVPGEIHYLINNINNTLGTYDFKKLDNEVNYWEKVQDLRENYLDKIRFGISDDFVNINLEIVVNLLKLILAKIEQGLDRALELSNGIMPTYLVYEPKSYEVIKDKFHPILNLPNVVVNEWDMRVLPLFLEAPARYIKSCNNMNDANILYQKVKQTGLYDKKLGMYITSESLENETLNIGRIRAFSAGWLERESCFMHMEYKYLLGLLKSGLYNEFFEDIKSCLPIYLDPKTYGRSILENSSFIASSVNPNHKNHGRGFVARLTGTTSEMISMYLLMMLGKNVFKYENDELTFELKPILTKEYFDENNEVSFNLLGETKIVYNNPKKLDTFGNDSCKVMEYHLFKNEDIDNPTIIFGTKINGKIAKDIRKGKYCSIIAILG